MGAEGKCSFRIPAIGRVSITSPILSVRLIIIFLGLFSIIRIFVLKGLNLYI
jgi:hypothetical protein